MENGQRGFRFRNIRKGLKKYKWLILVGTVGLVLLMIGIAGEKKTALPENDESAFRTAYVTELEGKICDLVKNLTGSSDCRVMITLRSGIEYVYATDASENNNNSPGGDSKEQSEKKVTVVSDKQSGEKAVIVTEKYPQVAGVAIICAAPNASSVILSVKNAVATALGIEQGHVCVILKG